MIVHVGYMDTGGISYSGAEFMAAAGSEDRLFAAMAAAFDDHLRDRGDDNREHWLAANGEHELGEQPFSEEFGKDTVGFGKALNDCYGITRERVGLGKGVRI